MKTMKMGNDEFILYVRKWNPGCTKTTEVLGREIWVWIKDTQMSMYGTTAIQIQKDAPCRWAQTDPSVAPDNLPKTATQFEFDSRLLGDLYTFLDTL